MKRSRKMAVALSVAGSDSGGGAGIQADLKTFHSLGVFGTCAITCITAQNPGCVSAVQPVRPRMVAEQMERVLEAFPIRAAKTGMLYDASIIKTISQVVRRKHLKNLVVDPVMIATSGVVLLKRNAVSALEKELLPLARVITPNLAEAEALTKSPLRSLPAVKEAARELANKFGVAVLIKGGHLEGMTQAVDVLCDRRRVMEFSASVIRNVKPHGAGCTFSAAITAYLARDFSLEESIRRAKSFVTNAIRYQWQLGRQRALRA